MEIVLNLGWMVLATLLFWLWLGYAPREGAGRLAQFVALTLIVLILFPAISMTDDIAFAQNSAETDCCLRKNHCSADALLTLHPVTQSLPPGLARLPLDASSSFAQNRLTASAVKFPAEDSIQNRPPPTV